jgi:hypothetical protein
MADFVALFDALPVRHDHGDHRTCPENLCETARGLHPEAIKIGMAALARAPEDDHAVVCVACAPEGAAVAVVGTRRGGWAVTGLRNDHVRRHGWYDHQPNEEWHPIIWKSRCFVISNGGVR